MIFRVFKCKARRHKERATLLTVSANHKMLRIWKSVAVAEFSQFNFRVARAKMASLNEINDRQI